MWFWNANYIALDMIKTQRQHYFSRFNPADLGDPPEAIGCWSIPGWHGDFSRADVLEAIAFFALASRRLGLLLAWVYSNASERVDAHGA